MAGRKIETIDDRSLARKRLPMFAGMDIPASIVRKEIIDNELDVVNERGQRANKCVIRIGKNRLQVMDNGHGISTEVKEGTDKTHLWIACTKMFSSSNYEGVEESLGANGVGLTIANFTSKRFTIAVLDGNGVKGYRFIDGFLCGTQECMNNIDALPGQFTDRDEAVAQIYGDMMENPVDKKDFMMEFQPYWENGFMVDVEWDERSPLFPDRLPDLAWLEKYTRIRTSELISGDVIFELYSDDSLSPNSLVYTHHWTKDKGSENYLPDWLEQCKEHGAVLVKDGPWTVALSKDPNMKIDSVVQGAPVVSRYTHDIPIEIQDYRISMPVPISFKYLSKDYPAYQDQTKTKIRFPYTQAANAFQRSGEVYKHFYREAEKHYMAKAIKDSDTSMFWPALGEAENAELIIAEGYSAISGLKSQRNPLTQACIALRGKILNCWNLEMQKAMNAEVVKQILNAVIYTKYKRIIIAVDADADGSHIASLLLAIFARFTRVLEDGKVYYVHTPHYLFKKRGRETLWSDNANDCPSGYHVTTLKGLGGMSADEVEKFIMNESTRELVKFEWDESAWENLDHAFSQGGKSWIIE